MKVAERRLVREKKNVGSHLIGHGPVPIIIPHSLLCLRIAGNELNKSEACFLEVSVSLHIRTRQIG